MRTTATPAEVEAWITVLRGRGHLHAAETTPEGTWTLQRTPDCPPVTLHHPVLAMDYIADVLLDLRRQNREGLR
ncbi:hypothetical protein ACLIYM_09690 [Streptomyces fenghuangensis]|uniref:hypothetical protein n=1 Tax=Streptomyces TaxID=1883 RepID=UPI001EDB1F09|nr:hypothetical protein [Streptomyces sp. ICN903]MCG3039008.1 hypothetical protein [Streptomyces sp. ICN903]